jgi:VWFA-related protein
MGVRASFSRAHRAILVLVCGLAFLAGLTALPKVAAASDAAATFRVSQAVVNLPDVRVYLDIGAADGGPAPNLGPENINAVIGTKPATVKSIVPFSTSGEGLAYIFLVDISKSLKEKQFRQMRQVLAALVDTMTDKDQAAIITFGEEVAEVQTFTANQATLKAEIAALKPTGEHTQLHLGLVKATDMGHRLDPGVPTRKVILILSDGEDDYEGGLTRQVVLEKMRVDPVPVYAIGFSNLTGEKRDQYLKSLGEFAVTSGGAYIRADSAQFEPAFQKMRHRILGAYVLKLSCEACQGDGGVHRLQVNFLGGSARMTDGLDIRLLAAPSQAPPVPKPSSAKLKEPQSPPKPNGLGSYWWVLLLAAVVIGVLALSRRKKAPPPPPPPPEPKGLKLRFTQIKGDPLQDPFEVTLHERLTMGRDSRCDIVLTDDKKISRNHCELIRRGEEIFVKDLGSKNTTLINGVPITGTHKLENDDTLALGNVEYRLGVMAP